MSPEGLSRAGSGNPAAESNAVVDRRPGNFGDFEGEHVPLGRGVDLRMLARDGEQFTPEPL